MLVCKLRSKKVKYLEPIPDPVEVKNIVISIRKNSEHITKINILNANNALGLLKTL